MNPLVVSVSIVTVDPAEATRAAEVLARAAAGLALEGISVAVTMATPTDDDDDE